MILSTIFYRFSKLNFKIFRISWKYWQDCSNNYHQSIKQQIWKILIGPSKLSEISRNPLPPPPGSEKREYNKSRVRNYHLTLCSSAMLPVRWMSPESIREGLFTPHTDVWSYGITLWELSTIGGFPYQGLSNAEVLEKVDIGCTLEIPHQSSREM